jgi:hypothetical protein
MECSFEAGFQYTAWKSKAVPARTLRKFLKGWQRIGGGMAYILEPDVAGGWGDGTIADTSSHPPVIQELEYRFEGLSDDDILTSFPVYIVTERLAKAIQSSHLTGYELSSMKISMSQEFLELYSNAVMPQYSWLKITGEDEKCDFSIGSDFRLVVSDRAFRLLNMYNLSECDVEEC